MDTTALGPFWNQIILFISLFLPVVLCFELVSSPKARFFGRRVRFNSVVAVRNWSFAVMTFGAFAYLVKAYQTLTFKTLHVASDVAVSLRGANGADATRLGKNAFSSFAWYPQGSFSITGLSNQDRLLVVVRDFFDQVSFLGLAAVLFVLCASAYRGKPFKNLVVKSLYAYAVIIALAQTGLQYMQGRLSGALAHDVAFLAHHSNQVTWPQGGSFTYPGWQFGLALLLVALAQIFKRGESLQRETEGLI